MIKLWLNFSRYTLIPVKCKSSSLSYNLTCLESQHRNKSSSKPVLNLFILVENQKRNPAICRKANSKSNGKMARIVVVVGTIPPAWAKERLPRWDRDRDKARPSSWMGVRKLLSSYSTPLIVVTIIILRALYSGCSASSSLGERRFSTAAAGTQFKSCCQTYPL